MPHVLLETVEEDKNLGLGRTDESKSTLPKSEILTGPQILRSWILY